MADALTAAGFNAAEIPVGVAIGLAESSPPGNTDSQHVNTDGSVDRGVWQINSINSDVIAREGGNPFDLYACARMARDIYLRQGWQAWSTYNSGKYKLMSQQASWMPIPGLPGPGVPIPDANPKGAPTYNLNPLSGITDNLGSITHVFSVLGNPDFWRRFGVGFLGAVVAIIGLATMLESNKTVQSATKLAAV